MRNRQRCWSRRIGAPAESRGCSDQMACKAGAAARRGYSVMPSVATEECPNSSAGCAARNGYWVGPVVGVFNEETPPGPEDGGELIRRGNVNAYGISIQGTCDIAMHGFLGVSSPPVRSSVSVGGGRTGHRCGCSGCRGLVVMGVRCLAIVRRCGASVSLLAPLRRSSTSQLAKRWA